MTFATPADRLSAAHVTQGFDVVGQQQGGATHARAGQRGFGAGMTAPDNDHIKMLRKKHEHALEKQPF
jgi:hypothetical protein